MEELRIIPVRNGFVVYAGGFDKYVVQDKNDTWVFRSADSLSQWIAGEYAEMVASGKKG
jgi:hypothetical protein